MTILYQVNTNPSKALINYVYNIDYYLMFYYNKKRLGVHKYLVYDNESTIYCENGF